MFSTFKATTHLQREKNAVRNRKGSIWDIYSILQSSNQLSVYLLISPDMTLASNQERHLSDRKSVWPRKTGHTDCICTETQAKILFSVIIQKIFCIIQIFSVISQKNRPRYYYSAGRVITVILLWYLTCFLKCHGWLFYLKLTQIYGLSPKCLDYPHVKDEKLVVMVSRMPTYLQSHQ